MKITNTMLTELLSMFILGLFAIKALFTGKGEKTDSKEENDMKTTAINNTADKKVKFEKQVLDDFRKNVGRFPAETGGMLASSKDENVIDRCYFDTHSQNTPGTFYYDVESMSVVFRKWKAKGYITNGIYHSHPNGVIHPSYHDISSALLHIDFFGIEYFYLPIIQSDRKGMYTMYFYIVRKLIETVEVRLSYVIRATKNGYSYIDYQEWKRSYPISQLRSYRSSIDKAERNVRKTSKVERAEESSGKYVHEVHNQKADYKHQQVSHISEDKSSHTNPSERSARQYFAKVSSLYPDHVLDKVLVCVGTGGARSYLENCARCGFRNFLLIDADNVSSSNIATQGVLISEIGRKKVDVIRDRILDINPVAKVVCIERFLDDNMSDEEFKHYMDMFPGRKPTDYLILGCTDNFDAQKRSSFLALKYGTPYLAAMMYEGGAAAEIIFLYPGVTESCPRCLLRDRFEKYEHGFKNDVTSDACPIFATERMNALKGYITLMLLMYHEDASNPMSYMLDDVRNRNFVEIRLNPYLKDSKLGIGLFDRVFSEASRYVYFDETIWVPQHPDRPEFGAKPCALCGGTGDLNAFRTMWEFRDTRAI